MKKSFIRQRIQELKEYFSKLMNVNDSDLLLKTVKTYF